MSGLKGRERLQPSLLDRLTDLAPAQKRDGPDQQVLSMTQLRQAVLRDLTALLNTTNLATLQDLADTPLAARSTLNFGMPGFAGMIDSPSRLGALERDIAEAIKAFEPRIRPETLRVRSGGSRNERCEPGDHLRDRGRTLGPARPGAAVPGNRDRGGDPHCRGQRSKGPTLMDPRLLRHYENELEFLRDMGSEFAAEFPKVAARLDIGSTDVADPYVERLLEGFAFLAARIQLKMEAEFPTFTQSLLQMVYPHYLAPTPAMAIVRITPDDMLRGTPQGVDLPAGLELRSLLGTEDQTNCEFRTAHAVRLLPIEITEAEYIVSPAAVAALGLPDLPNTRAAIRLRLRTMGDIPVAKLALEGLTFFLGGPENARTRLYEQLSAHVCGIVVRPGTRPVPWQDRLPRTALRPAGFEPEEALLPRLPASFDGYRLLQEYFAMPERFLFFNLTGLARAAIRCTSPEIEITILLDRGDPSLLAFGPDHMQLHCTPAINLFEKRSDRMNLAERDVEHLIVPDRMRPLDYEVFSVIGMEGFAADGGTPQQFFPFYAANDLSRNPGHRSYYMLRRQPRRISTRAHERGPRSNYLGHDVFVSLVDADNAPVKASLRQLGLDLLCTNRDLTLAMPVGKRHTDFTVVVNAPVASIRCVTGPTPPRPCRADGEYAWRFISHLSLNYLSLTDNDEMHGAAALRELLRLYVPAGSSQASRQLDALLSVASTPVVRRIPGAGPLCAGRGLEVTLTLDETPFGGASGILLGAVLDRFFAKYVSINGFTETVLRSPDRGEVMRWPLQLGQRPLL